MGVALAFVNANALTSPNAILEMQLFVDGVLVADHQDVNGTDEMQLSYSTVYPSGGTHQLSLRLVKQRYVTEMYALVGGVVAVYGSTVVQEDFPGDSIVTLAAGGIVNISIGVP